MLGCTTFFTRSISLLGSKCKGFPYKLHRVYDKNVVKVKLNKNTLLYDCCTGLHRVLHHVAPGWLIPSPHRALPLRGAGDVVRR